MKSIGFLLTLITALSACSSEPPVVKDENELSPGIMQADTSTGAVEGASFMSSVQPQSMPATMTSAAQTENPPAQTQQF